MPIYEYQCDYCGHKFEALVRLNEQAPPCPKCELPFAIQLISLCSFRMKERGFEIKRGAGHNPYQDLVLDNIRDEQGKPVKVNSEAELHAAEKRYSFIHNASWGLEKEPPQHEKDAGKLRRYRDPKFNRDPAAYSDAEIEKAAKEVGYVHSGEETLANLPNSSRSIPT